MSQHSETIVCPACGKHCVAVVKHTEPFWTYVHTCECGYTILESEWEKIETRQREISFRARRLDNGEWVEGYYCELDGIDYIVRIISNENAQDIPYYEMIRPSTLCQFTGLYDKNGERIWEGDVVLLGDNPIHDGTKVKCIYSQHRAQFIYEFLDGDNKGRCTDMFDTWRSYTRLGSVHDGEGE